MYVIKRRYVVDGPFFFFVAGIVSNEGHYPNLPDKEFQKLLTLGPISRYARDLRLGLRVMAGEGASALRLDSPVSPVCPAPTYETHVEYCVYVFMAHYEYTPRTHIRVHT